MVSKLSLLFCTPAHSNSSVLLQSLGLEAIEISFAREVDLAVLLRIRISKLLAYVSGIAKSCEAAGLPVLSIESLRQSNRLIYFLLLSIRAGLSFSAKFRQLAGHAGVSQLIFC